MSIVRRESKTDPRLAWFDEARFGMFIHFGLFTLTGKGAWAQYRHRIPYAEYEALMERFDPEDFDAEDWVDVAERAGARYLTLTTKHHDGFCLFDSEWTDYKITNTPFGRDLVREVVDACHRRELPILLYYSQPDWRHPAFPNLPGAIKDRYWPRPDDAPDEAVYRDYIHGQVHELVTKYGRIDGLWFDGSHKSAETWGAEALYDLVKAHQPHAVVNDRGRRGDYYTPERSLPEDLGGYLFEACASLTKSDWSWKPEETLASVPAELDALVRMAGAGGNYLLNVTPDPKGVIPAEQIDRMEAIGRWLQVNGQAIYATQGLRLAEMPESIRATRKGPDLFVILRDWPPADRIVIPGIESAPRTVRLLSTRQLLKHRLVEEGLEVMGLPGLPPEATPQVLWLCFSGRAHLRVPEAESKLMAAPPAILLPPKGEAILPADAADRSGFGVKGARLECVEAPLDGGLEGETEALLTNWSSPEQLADWRIQSAREREMTVRVELRCPMLYAGSSFRLTLRSPTAGEQVLEAGVTGSPGSEDWEAPEIPGWRPDMGEAAWYRQELGAVTIAKGTTDLILAPLEMPYGYIFAEVRAIILTPAGGRRGKAGASSKSSAKKADKKAEKKTATKVAKKTAKKAAKKKAAKTSTKKAASKTTATGKRASDTKTTKAAGASRAGKKATTRKTAAKRVPNQNRSTAKGAGASSTTTPSTGGASNESAAD